MKLVLNEKHIIYKIKNIFLIISELKITFFLKETSIIIQGINKENTCLCEIKLDNDILKDYNKGSVDYFSISGNLMHSILKLHEESEEIHLQLTDILQIEFIENNKLIKNFEISLLNSNGDFILF